MFVTAFPPAFLSGTKKRGWTNGSLTIAQPNQSAVRDEHWRF